MAFVPVVIDDEITDPNDVRLLGTLPVQASISGIEATLSSFQINFDTEYSPYFVSEEVLVTLNLVPETPVTLYFERRTISGDILPGSYRKRLVAFGINPPPEKQ